MIAVTFADLVVAAVYVVLVIYTVALFADWLIDRAVGRRRPPRFPKPPTRPRRHR